MSESLHRAISAGSVMLAAKRSRKRGQKGFGKVNLSFTKWYDARREIQMKRDFLRETAFAVVPVLRKWAELRAGPDPITRRSIVTFSHHSEPNTRATPDELLNRAELDTITGRSLTFEIAAEASMLFIGGLRRGEIKIEVVRVAPTGKQTQRVELMERKGQTDDFLIHDLERLLEEFENEAFPL